MSLEAGQNNRRLGGVLVLLALSLLALASVCSAVEATDRSPGPPSTPVALGPTAAALPVPLAASPSPSPAPTVRPTPTALPLSPGQLPPDTASVTYVPESGFPVAVAGLAAACTRSGDSLGLAGLGLEGPLAARYVMTIAPFRGNGVYLTNEAVVQIGGSVTITGVLQTFIGPPHETVATIAQEGALGVIRYTGINVDGRRAAGSIRWECGELRQALG